MKPDSLESMGLAYVPFTFPTVTVQNNAKLAGTVLSIGEVDRLWVAYKDGTVNNGIPPYAHEAGGKNLAIIQFMEHATNLDRMKIAAFLNALEQTVNQGWGFGWIDPVAGGKASTPLDVVKTATDKAGAIVGDFLKPSAEPLTNLIKWSAVLVVGGAVVYGLWTASKFIKGKKGRKG